MQKEQVKNLNNDIYFIETVADRVVINNNYEGILIYDYNLNLLEKIDLFEGIIISGVIKKDNELLLLCVENKCMVHVDVYSLQYNVINSINAHEAIFPMVHYWDGGNIIVMTYKGAFFCIDLTEENCYLVDDASIYQNHKSFYEDYLKLRDLKIYKHFPLDNNVIIRKNVLRLAMVNYSKKLTELLEFEEESYHDFEFYEGVFVKISEDKVQIEKEQIQTNIHPMQGYSYLAAKIMRVKDKYWIYVLCGNKADECDTIVETYRI